MIVWHKSRCFKLIISLLKRGGILENQIQRGDPEVTATDDNCDVNPDAKDLSWFLEGHPLTASLRSQPDALPSTNLLKNFSMNTGWGE